ncbi:GAF domain-containing protein [Saccharothrix mutabilis subsp. mutabilis]|uniref:GAF domain-containing protein n=1 Tax=Saccharothrix mutabilis subsp. mutabilis TaxID=66855 RepID=A0ABN0UI04_9PSEU
MTQDEWRSADERRTWLWGRIRDLAGQGGTTVSVRHVCAVAATTLDACGVVFYETAPDGDGAVPVAVTDPVADVLSEAEVTTGEGPAIEAVLDECPALVADLDTKVNLARWPVFAPIALAHGVCAVSAFPVCLGAIVVGCLEVYHAEPVEVDRERLADGLLLADAVVVVLLSGLPAATGVDPFADAVEARWATVQQAAGVVSAQLDVDLTTAFVRLRAHAYCTDRRLTDVAADVVTGRERFSPEPGAGPGWGPWPEERR